MKTTKEIYADVMQKDMVKTVIAKQYDCNSRFLCVRFANYGVIMQAAQDDVAVVNVQRSDGEVKAFRGTVNEDGSITVPLTSWMSELAGRLKCDISIVSPDGSKLTSMVFPISVEPAVYSGEEISEDEHYDILVSLINDVQNTEAEISAAETARVQAEKERVSAETARDNAEKDRISAETQRVTAETNRTEAERNREYAEDYRQSNEAERNTAEAERAAAEGKRASAEADRASAESKRQTAENNRLSAEKDRNTAESNRQSAEANRAAAESARAGAETQRVNAEKNRNTNESNRISAEKARAEAESARVQAEEQRALAESERRSAETERTKAEVLRVEAETARNAAETARSEAEENRAAELAKKADREEMLDKLCPHTTISEYPVSITDHLADESVIDYKIYGNSVQDGTPSPDSPVDIVSVGDLVTDTASEYYGKYNVPVTVTGKNLLSVKDLYPTTESSAYGLSISQIDDYTLELNGTCTISSSYLNFFVRRLIIPIKVDTTNKYSLSVKYISGTTNNPDNTYNSVYYGKSDSPSGTVTNWGSIKLDNTDTSTSNISIDKNYISQIRILVGNGVSYENYRFQLQIEEGETATEYEPYTSSTQHIYLDEPLRKVGDYADYIDFKNQKVVRFVKEKTFDGTENFNDAYIASFNRITYPLPHLHLSTSVAMLTRSIWGNTATIWANATNIAFDISYYGVATLDEFKTKLMEWYDDGKPLKMYYILGTQTEESIIVPELTAPISSVANISTETEISPSNMDVEYYQDINTVINNLTNAILSQGGNV